MSIDQLQNNINVHNKIAGKYHKVHPEIFNPIEQKRLKEILAYAVSLIDSNLEGKINVLDYGTGSGNLTAHLLDLDLSVVSADISEGFLEEIKQQFRSNPNSSTYLLNGVDLSGISANSFDMIASYSVLHHIPDYLLAIKDMCRTIKPGGLLFFDHDASPMVWSDNQSLTEFMKKNHSERMANRLLRLFSIDFYVRRFKKMKNPRWQSEGDIHVWKDDHVEWDKIDDLLNNMGFEKIYCEDYLHYSSNYDIAEWEYYRKKCNDIRCVIYRKNV